MANASLPTATALGVPASLVGTLTTAPASTSSGGSGKIPARALPHLVAEAAGDDDGEDLETRFMREAARAGSTYFMTADDSERRRLHVQVNDVEKESVYGAPPVAEIAVQIVHMVLRHLFAGLFHTPQQALFEDPAGEARVLDMGCGSGAWTLDMAVKYPNASFVGGRAMVVAIPKSRWPDDVRELIRVAKPGGYIQLIDASAVYYHYDPERPSELIPVTSGPFFEMVTPCDRLALLCSSAGLEDVKERVAVFPIGWNGAIGRLGADDFRQAFTGTSKRLFMGSRDDASYEKLVDEAFKQAAEEHIYIKTVCVTGRV
ncbi:hypothetical protein HK405_013286, partial [Cladochytrium tenue]